MGAFQHVGIVFEVEGVGIDLVHEQGGSTDRCEWFTREEAAGLPLVPLPLVPLAEFAVTLARPEQS